MSQEQFYRRRFLLDGRMRNPYDERRGGRRRQPKLKKKGTGQERFIDPKDFSQVYQNPLANLFPLLQYFTGLEIEKQNKEMNRPEDDEYRRMREREYRMRGRGGEQDSDEQYQKKIVKKNPIVGIIGNRRNNTFQGYKNEIVLRLKRDKQSMNSNRRNNLSFIQQNLRYDLKNKLLNQSQVEQRWVGVKKIIEDKLAILDSNFKKNRILLQKVKQYDQFVSAAQKSKTQLKMFKNLDLKQQILAYNLILCYFTIPTEQTLHSQITNFSQKSNSIFRRLLDEQQKLRKVVFSLPYKQSSFYWAKIIQCCRSISDIDHYASLTRYRLDNFQAEYGGLITHQIMKNLMENQWLDNTITSTIIEYLKNVQGANNYHNDDNFKSCIFTHSQTQIFINSQRDMQNKYVSYQKLIFLVNHKNQHWFVITAYLTNRELVVYNSLSNYLRVQQDYCEKIINRLKALSKRHKGTDLDLRIEYQYSPKQNNTSDCGVFAIANVICAFDRQKNHQRRNKYSSDIILQLRNSLFLFLLYLGYCKRYQVVPRKDYFDILFRSTIHYNMKSKLHEDKKKI